jgi:hypothetical protein
MSNDQKIINFVKHIYVMPFNVMLIKNICVKFLMILNHFQLLYVIMS